MALQMSQDTSVFSAAAPSGGPGDSSSNSSTNATGNTDNDDASGDLDEIGEALIAGIAVGGVVVIMGAVAAYYFVFRGGEASGARGSTDGTQSPAEPGLSYRAVKEDKGPRDGTAKLKANSVAPSKELALGTFDGNNPIPVA